MVTVTQTKPIPISKEKNPLDRPHGRRLIRNTTASGDLYILKEEQIIGSNVIAQYVSDGFHLIGIDEVEYTKYRGTLWAVAQTANCDVRIIEE